MSEPKSKKRRVTEPTENKPITDPRFTNLQSDPRYRLPSKKHKVKLDKRFSHALKDDDFSRRAKVDRYGRPLETDSERKRLKRKYEFEDGDDQESAHTDEVDDDDEVQRELNRVQSKPRDFLREGVDSDSSSDSSSSSEDDDEDEDGQGEQAELAPRTKSEVPLGQVSSRIAVVNLDWDNIRAQDLMAVFSSSGFLPPNGKLLKVSIYPSEFGKERMAREEMEGPPPEIFANSTKKNGEAPSENEDESEEGEEDDDEIKKDILAPDDGTLDFDSTTLRNYQLERLRYYYAVLTFSSPAAAKAIYDAVDGTEYLSTANFFDLRFVPDDVSFEDDEPREECTSVSAEYKPTDFATDALQHSKVKLTWDTEDGSRKEAQARAFRGGRKELDENDLKAYLGTDSSSASEPDLDDDAPSTKKEVERLKMRSLLGLPSEPVKSKKKVGDTPVGGVQVTFSAGLSSTADSQKKRSVFENSPEPEETTVERYARKERERKQKRKERMKANREGNSVAEEDHDASKETEEAVAADTGFDDPFFAEPSLDKSASNKIRKEERLKKKKEREEEEVAERKQRAELELLMRDDASSESEAGSNVRGKKTLRHFDMREIEKAEKVKRKEEKRMAKKSKSSKTNDGKHEAENDTDGFKVDTSDPRFAPVYENHEYAIDPTNPRYRGTKGMESLLEEGRKRKSKKSKGSQAESDQQVLPDGHDEVTSLVEKIKKRKA